MTPNPDVMITVNLQPGRAEVRLGLDGTATVHLRAVMVARKDVTGRIQFDADTTVTSNRVEDSFVHTPLRSHVLRAAENRARACLRQALKVTARVLTTHTQAGGDTT